MKFKRFLRRPEDVNCEGREPCEGKRWDADAKADNGSLATSISQM